MMMKKFLALFLVLVMALTCVLVSCKKNAGTGDDTTTTAEEGWMTPPPSTTTAPAATTPAVTTAPDKPSTDYTWTADTAGTTVYVRIDVLNVRSDTIIKDTTVVGQIKFGESFTRVKYNDQWTVISYKGAERYVSTAYITTDSGSVVFEVVEEKSMYINVEATLNLRSSTYHTNPDGTTFTDNILVPLKRAVVVTKLQESKNGSWAKVKYVYTNDEGETETYIGYCNTSYLSEVHPDDIKEPGVTAKPVG
jgi:uncharacterized protein YgiM (DUF1202 family)